MVTQQTLGKLTSAFGELITTELPYGVAITDTNLYITNAPETVFRSIRSENVIIRNRVLSQDRSSSKSAGDIASYALERSSSTRCRFRIVRQSAEPIREI